MYGFSRVNASSEWAAMVATTEMNTHDKLRPHRSMTYPKIGLATAEMMYRIELTVLASAGEKPNRSMKNIL